MVALGVEWREFERTGLVDEITAFLRAGRSVLIDGEAGVGKSTVARQAAPAESVWLQGLEGLSSVSLAPLALVEAERPLDSVASAYRWLRDQADAGVTLVVDDAQWFDPVTAGLLAQAVVHDRIRAIVSVRSGHALGEDLARAVADFHRITVEPLDASMVELALELALEDEPGAALVEVFSRRSGGNPLHLRELVLEALTNGSLQREPGEGWRLAGDLSASASLVQLIDSRLSRVDAAVRHAVELVVVGDHMPVALLAEVADPVHVAAAVEAALLRERGSEIYPGHPTVGDAVAKGLSRTRRTALVRELVDASVDVPGPDIRLRRLQWQLDLSDVPQLAELDAGYAAAVRASNLDLAGRFASTAHEHYPSLVNGLRAANQLHRDGRHRDATLLVESLQPFAASPDEAALIASHLLRTQGKLGLHLGTNPGAGPLRADILDWAETQLVGAPFTELRRSAEAFNAGDARGALAHLEALLDHPNGIVRHDARERMMGVNLFLDEREVYRHSVALEEVDDPYVNDRPQIHRTMWWVSRSVGQVGESYERTRSAFEHIDELADTTAQSVAQAHAFMGVLTGRIDEALDAALLARNLSVPGSRNAAGAEFVEGMSLSFAGYPERGDVAMSSALDMARASNDPIRAPLHEVHRLFHRAAYGRAQSETLGALRALAEQRDSFAETHALVVLARLGRADQALVERLDELAPTGAYTAAMAAAARAHLARDPGALCVAAERLEVIGTFPEALESLAAAVALYQKGGDQTASLQLAKRHQDLLAQCPGLRWPLAAIAIDAPDLTAREHQICELAALGWSNRQIAAELTISVRTAENNLQRAYAKLGINRRSDLPAALGLQAA